MNSKILELLEKEKLDFLRAVENASTITKRVHTETGVREEIYVSKRDLLLYLKAAIEQ